MKKLILTDNEYVYKNMEKILNEVSLLELFDFAYSYNNNIFEQKFKHKKIKPINIKKEKLSLIKNYDLIISAHCKQIFPRELVENVRCINIHPGYNPYNRGWYPQVFSINNKLPAGVTVHLMDEYLDHGPIIYQEKIDIYDWETSKDVYNRILKLEIEMLKNNIQNIVNNNYDIIHPTSEGNINSIKDFNDLCKLDLEEKLTMKEAIDKLRALTHGDFKNAYFYDEKGNKIYVKIQLIKDE